MQLLNDPDYTPGLTRNSFPRYKEVRMKNEVVKND